MVLDSIVERLEGEVEDLKEQTARKMREIVAYLARRDSSLRLRPRLKGNKSGTFSLVWVRYLGYDPATRSPLKQEIPRGRGHLIPRATLLSHLEDSEPWEQEFVWEKEQEFAEIREQVSLLSQALAALKQYAKAR